MKLKDISQRGKEILRPYLFFNMEPSRRDPKVNMIRVDNNSKQKKGPARCSICSSSLRKNNPSPKKDKTSTEPSRLSFKLETTYRNVRKKPTKRKSFYNRSHLDDTPTDGGSSRRTFSPRECQLNRWVNSVLGATKSRRQLRDRVEQAINDNKIFLNMGQCECVQKALLKRGWVEKPCSDISWKMISSKPLEAWAHQVLQQCTPDLIWNHSGQVMPWREIRDHQFVNQSPGPKIAFTSKDGLSYCLEGSQWFQETEKISVNFPRSYNLLLPDERAVFISDYCMTACMSTLKLVNALYDQEGLEGLFGDGEGTFDWAWIDFATQHVLHYCRVRNHEDLDGGLMSPSTSILRWDLFLSQYHELASSSAKMKFIQIKKEDANKKIIKSKAALESVSLYWPHINIDGTNNIWICKPGIFKEIDSSWVVQKYIERPLLIHKTKFDIRQWFLVSCWNPLTVWFYKDCYFRFCSRRFDLEDFHESIHLCNTAVQSKYSHIKRPHSSPIPSDNIWEKETFKEYLKVIGKEDKWTTWIYPGMKKGLLGAILPSQELLLESGTTKIRRKSFELYGADFLISEDFVPWLIEVNATPMLHSPSPKFKRMTRECLEDCLKVVLDWRDDPNTDTGRFELIYEQTEPLSRFMQVAKGEMCVVGRSVNTPMLTRKKSGRSPMANKSKNINLNSRTFSSKMLAAVNPSVLAFKLRKTLVNLFSNCNLASKSFIRSRTIVKEKQSVLRSRLEEEIELKLREEKPCAVTPEVNYSGCLQEAPSVQLNLASVHRRLSERSMEPNVSTNSVSPIRTEAKASVSAQLPTSYLCAAARLQASSGSVSVQPPTPSIHIPKIMKQLTSPKTAISDTCLKLYSLKTILGNLQSDDGNKDDTA
ncbi:unnamed protein product [Allacma fusca]|uniref:Tubulin glycylase 3A n=1 Tax=Allacma fusca TaxID=39272 RepID=A0A8J2PT40_9HEXA|nr:unnamed protein product [Allacma fusca]